MSWLNGIRAKSISVMLINAGGCTGCARQFQAALLLDSGKGITLTGNPRHADVLFVAGCINNKSADYLKEINNKMPSPKAVIAAGACACEGSLFRSEENGINPLEKVLPVNTYVRGCIPEMDKMLEAVINVVEDGYKEYKDGWDHDTELER
ncbi:MAG: Ni,Fe-hydrogenase III small subunit [Clostridiaceae bacterium]|nr:Ni,Fe-hydrogenase III small subunit [Clostridiaceae bacterium]